MIMTMEYVDILDETEALSKMIVRSEVMHRYEQAHRQLYSDEHATQLIRSFAAIKDQHEEVERFGTYHPDYSRIMREVRSVKREMDMHTYVAELKLRERELQRFLDDISELIAASVSEQVIVPREDGLYDNHLCRTGNCGTGQSCSCSAS